MRVVVQHTLDDLVSDLRKIATTARSDLARTVRENARKGNTLAKGYARVSAGAHGKHYHKAFSVEALSPLVWEYGPEVGRRQGGMSFEGGSRNQPPHNDLAKSADIIAPAFAKDVGALPERWFWPR